MQAADARPVRRPWPARVRRDSARSPPGARMPSAGRARRAGRPGARWRVPVVAPGSGLRRPSWRAPAAAPAPCCAAAPPSRLRRESVTTPAAAALVQRCCEVAPDGSASLPVAGSEWRQDDVREAFEEPWEPEPIEVHILAWPEDEEQRRKLADERMPRLLRIEAGASPPELWDELEDWYREGSSTADVLARRDTVQVRAARRAREPVLDGSVLRVGRHWVAIPRRGCRSWRCCCPAGARSCARTSSSRPSPPGAAARTRPRCGLCSTVWPRPLPPSACSCTACGAGARCSRCPRADRGRRFRFAQPAPDAAKKKERCRSGFSGPWRRRAGDETRTKHVTLQPFACLTTRQGADVEIDTGEHRLGTHLDGPGAVHDTGAGAVLRRHGPGQERARHAHAELLRHGDPRHPLGGDRVHPGVR